MAFLLHLTRSSFEPCFPVLKREEGRGVQRKSKSQISVFWPTCFLSFSTGPKHWKHHLAQSVVNREGCDLFLSPNTLQWHVARDPNGKASNKKAMLAHGLMALAQGHCLGSGQLQQNFQREFYDPLSSKPPFGPRPDYF